MDPPFGGQHRQVGRGGGMFQNRWGIVSEKVPTSWGNDSEKSQGQQLVRMRSSSYSVDAVPAGRDRGCPAGGTGVGLSGLLVVVKGRCACPSVDTWGRFNEA